MNDYRLQFTDETAWLAAADALGWLQHEYSQDPEPTIVRSWVSAAGVDIDVIGAIFKPTGNMLTLEPGVEYPEMTAIPGFHVNIRLHQDRLPDSLRPFRVIPNQPARTFAGGWYEGE
jgi:hypothetical protein